MPKSKLGRRPIQLTARGCLGSEAASEQVARLASIKSRPGARSFFSGAGPPACHSEREWTVPCERRGLQ